jgi:zinc/manganese transport system ATP-binding protein
MPAIRFDHVTLGYDGHPAVHHLDGTVKRGSLTAVVGPNGSGKSTLLKGIAGLLEPLSGAIAFQNLSRRDIAYLPQFSEIGRDFPAAIVDLLSFGLLRKCGLFGGIGLGFAHDMARALEAVGLGGFAERPIDTLSGGQLQRALFARVLLQDARIILLDEPFSAIDEKTVSDLLGLIRRWHGEERTVIAVLHDMSLVRDSFPETLLLAREPVAWGETADVLKPANLLQARRMNEAWDDHAPWCEADRAA